MLLQSVFPPRERELMIIRTAALCNCVYELEHRLEMGTEVGLTERELSVLLTTEQLIELPMLVGHYILLAGTLRSLGVPLDSEQAEPETAQ